MLYGLLIAGRMVAFFVDQMVFGRGRWRQRFVWDERLGTTSVRNFNTMANFHYPASRNRFTFRFFLDFLKNTTTMVVLEILILFYQEPKHAIRLVARYIEDFLAMYDRAGEEVE